MSDPSKMIPVSEALADPTLPAGLSREVAVRLVQRREVEGMQVAGRWLCNPESLRAWLLSEPKPAA